VQAKLQDNGIIHRREKKTYMFYTEVKKNTKKRFYSFNIGLAVCVGKIVPYLLRSAGGVLISLTSALSL